MHSTIPLTASNTRPHGLTLLQVGGNDGQIADRKDFVTGLVDDALAILYRYGDFTHTPPVDPVHVRGLIMQASTRAITAYHAVTKLSELGLDATAAPPPPYRYYLAAHAACGLTRDTAGIFTEALPSMTPALRRLGASDYLPGCAFMLAVHIADRGADVMAVPDRPEIVTPFLSTLDKLLTYDGDHTQDQVAPVLVDCLVQRRVRQDSSSDRPPTYSTDPRPRPTPPDDRDQRWSTAAAGRAIAVAAVALLVGVLVGALGTRPWRHDDQVTTSSATVTPTTITTTLTAAPSPPGPEAALSGAPTLDHVSIQLLAHPKGSQIDPAVIAVPEHSTHARATMAMGGVLDVEIQLALRTGVTPDPDEHFYIGLWPSGLMTLQPNTTTVSQPNVPSTRINDLKPTPTTAVTDLDPHGAPTKYTLNVAAVPQPAVTGASPGSGYFCGYNTQAVNAILVSSKHSATQILTTLPVSVLRTTDCG